MLERVVNDERMKDVWSTLIKAAKYDADEATDIFFMDLLSGPVHWSRSVFLSQKDIKDYCNEIIKLSKSLLEILNTRSEDYNKDQLRMSINDNLGEYIVDALKAENYNYHPASGKIIQMFESNSYLLGQRLPSISDILSALTRKTEHYRDNFDQ